MPKLEVMYSQILKQQDRILISVYQTGTFREKVNTKLKNDMGAQKKRLTQAYVKNTLQTVKTNINQGLPGEQGSAPKNYKPKPVSTEFEIYGPFGETVQTTVRFPGLAASTIRNKTKRMGRGKFYLDHGVTAGGRESLRSALAKVKPPKVDMNTAISKLSVRKLKKKAGKIDFTISLGISEMPYPLDEMVRRPLITQVAARSDKGGAGGDDKLAVIGALEYGATRSLGDRSITIPARRWISKMAAQMGREMFDKLNSN